MYIYHYLFLIFIIVSPVSQAIPYNLSYGGDITSLDSNWIKSYSSEKINNWKGVNKYCRKINDGASRFVIEVPPTLGAYRLGWLYSKYLTTESGREMYLSGRSNPMDSTFKTDTGQFILSELFKSKEFENYLSLVERYNNASLMLKQVVYNHREKYMCIGFISNKIFHVSITSEGANSRFPIILNKVIKKYNQVSTDIYRIKNSEEWGGISFEDTICKEDSNCYIKKLRLKTAIKYEVVEVAYLAESTDISFFKNYHERHVDNMHISFSNQSMIDIRNSKITNFNREFNEVVLPDIHKKMIKTLNSYEKKSINDESTF